MEGINDKSRHLNLTTHLLESTKCNRFTDINVSVMNSDDTFNTAREKLMTLIATIHNAPSLQQIVLRETPITLVDMENLHRGAPNLESVKLDCVVIHTEGPP